MSNPFRDIAAGVLDLPGFALDTINLFVGTGTGLANKLDGGDFAEGFVDNPFGRMSMNYYDWVSDFTGADEDSFIRTAVGLVPAFTGAGALAKGGVAATKAYSRNLAKGLTKEAARKKAGKETVRFLKNELKTKMKPTALAGELGSASIPMAAISLFTDDSPQDDIWKALALGTLGWRGLKRLRGARTRTDLARAAGLLGASTVGGAAGLETLLERSKRRQKWIDDIGGATDSIKAIVGDGLDYTALNTSIEKEVLKNPLLKKVAEIVDKFNPSDEERMFGGLTETMGARIGEMRDALQWAGLGYNNAMDFTKKSMEEARAMYHELVLKSKQDIVKTFKEYQEYLDDIGLVKGLDNISNKKLLEQYEIYSKKVGRTHFMTPEMKSVTKEVLAQARDAGAIDLQTYYRGINDIDSGLYIPMRSDEVRDLSKVEKSDNAFRNQRHRPFEYDYSDVNTGINDTRNPMEVWATKLVSELEGVARQIKVNNYLEQAVRRFNNAVGQLQQRGLKDKEIKRILDEYGIQRVVYKPYSEDYIKDYARKKNLTTDKALEVLSSRYLKKGLVPLNTYEQGKKFVSFVPPEFKIIFNQRPVNDSTMKKLMVAMNKPFMASLTSKWNPAFWTKRAMYPFWEAMPAVRSLTGKEVPLLSLMAIYAKSFQESAVNALCTNMIRAIDENAKIGIPAKGSRAWFERHVKDLTEEYHDMGIISNDVFGETIRNSNGTIDISLSPNTADGIRRKVRAGVNWANNSSLGIVLQILQDTLDDTSRRFMYKSAKEYMAGKEKDFIMAANRMLADTSRRGTGTDTVGKILNAIQDYVPYGSSIVQGIAGKLEHLPKDVVKRITQYAEDAYKVNDGKIVETGFDLLTKAGVALSQLPDNAVFDTLFKLVALPATICYIWNYGNEENAKYYNSLQPWERSNKFQLVNFFGEGKNLSVPIDQEWSVVKNLYDIMMEYQFGLGESYDRGNPDFSMRDQLVWSLDQDFGISLPVGAEGALNMLGYETNIGPSNIINGESPVSSIPTNRYKGDYDYLNTAVISLTGNLGKTLVNIQQDRPTMDYRYIIPFMQINPKQKPTSDTVSFLNTQLRTNPTPELIEWNKQRKMLMADKSFYERNGCTRSGKILGKRDEVLENYQDQIDELNRTTYYSVVG